MLITGLRRRWKIGAIICLLVGGGTALFFGLAWGLAFGMTFGVSLPLFLEYLDQTIKRADDVRNSLGITLFGTLPRLPVESKHDGLPERRLITSFPAEEPGVGCYRALCSKLESYRDGEKNTLMMVTSCIPGEGKSTVSANLAVTLAESGKRVLLIGCDLRRPTLGELFGETHQPGLSDLLSKGDSSGLRKLTSPAIDFMPAGEIPLNPAELLDSERMRQYLASVRADYDYVVLDAPPVLAVTDTQLLAPLCDLRVMVLEPCRIPLPMAKKLIETLQSVGARIDGVILNDRSGRAARHYGAPGEYGRERDDQGKSTGKSRKASTYPSSQVSPLGKLLLGTSLLLAVVIAGLSWQVLNKGKETSELKVPTIVASLAPGDDGRNEMVARGQAENTSSVVGQEVTLPPQNNSSQAEQGTGQVEQATAEVEQVTKAEQVAEKVEQVAEKVEQVAEKVEQVTGVDSIEEPAAPIDKRAGQKTEPIPAIAMVDESEPVAAVAAPDPVPVPAVAPRQTLKPTGKVKTAAKATPAEDGLKPALEALARSWRRTLPETLGSESLTVETGLKGMGLLSSPLAPDLSVSLQYGTPLLLETRHAETGATWIAVVGRRGFKWQVSPQPRQGEFLSELDLERIWTGRGYLPWQDPLQLISLGAGVDDPERTTRLQQLLVKAGYARPFEQGVYGRETLKAVGNLQAASGLEVNGGMTPETLVLLYQADPAFMMPEFSLW